MTSADQDAWTDLASLLREGIRKKAANLAIMSGEEIKALVDAAHEAQCITFRAATFDRDVELKNGRSTWEEGI